MICCQNNCNQFYFAPEPPKGPNDKCPRLNGFYSHPDSSVCNIFYECVDGRAKEQKCLGDLIFDESKGFCNYPEDTDRTGCKASGGKPSLSIQNNKLISPSMAYRAWLLLLQMNAL